MAACTSPITIELSSDSEDAVSFGNSQTASQTCTSQPSDDVFTLDWADDGPPGGYDQLDLDYELPDVEDRDNSVSSAETVIYSPPELILEESSAKPSASQTASNIGCKQDEKQIKEQQKREKQRLRAEKKAETLKEKRIKAALAQKHKLLKPEENIKLVRVNIDTKIVTSEMGGIVITSLQQAGIQYDVGNQIKSNTVSWSKKMVDILVTDEEVRLENVGDKDESELLYVINFEEIVKLIKLNELLVHIQTIKSVYVDRFLTVVIVGMQKYFSLLKKNRSKENDSRRDKGRKSNPDDINIKNELDFALVELQLIGRTNHWFIETGEELASLIITTTKSLSQLDYKTEKHKQEDLDWFAKGDARQCVKVDKNGNGLLSLWQRQICQFNSVGIEMASAIVSKFNSPQELIRSYEKCSSRSEAELLLQNIQMRRNAGLLSSTRRIGPEVSKKLYHFYMSDDPDLEL